MECPLCGHTQDKVIESRQSRSGTSIRRRRECLECNYRFTSYEKLDIKPLMVVKRGKSRQPFDINKVGRGLQRALEKRPVSISTFEMLLHEIEDEAEMEGKTSREIASERLGNIVLEKLHAVDKVAYIRFASVYKKFESVEEFIKEIESIT